jgi:hypothetical protein
MNAAIVGALRCQISLLTLRSSPFSLGLGDSVFATVTSTNAYGESSQSPQGNGATIVLVPDAPTAVLDNTAVTSASIIGIKWSNGVSQGGSTVLDYRVSYDQSVGTWVVLATGVVPLVYQTTMTITPGASYKFKVEARNSVGYSLQSS